MAIVAATEHFFVEGLHVRKPVLDAMARRADSNNRLPGVDVLPHQIHLVRRKYDAPRKQHQNVGLRQLLQSWNAVPLVLTERPETNDAFLFQVRLKFAQRFMRTIFRRC
jgi:hypothetical protein